KCLAPETCIRLHLGDGPDDTTKKALAAKRKEKRETKKSEKKDGMEYKAPKVKKVNAKKKHWLCPGCGNKNFGRREVCNGAVCGTSRPDKWDTLRDEDFDGPPQPVRRNKKRNFDEDDEDEKDTHQSDPPARNANKKLRLDEE
ncbi:hypothetical protein CYMTET_9993, partial [Cymbomonas tetramitiformis]